MSIQTQISNLVPTTCFWDNLHQVALKFEKLESQIIECVGSNKQDRQIQLWSPMSEGEEP